MELQQNTEPDPDETERERERRVHGREPGREQRLIDGTLERHALIVVVDENHRVDEPCDQTRSHESDERIRPIDDEKVRPPTDTVHVHEPHDRRWTNFFVIYG